jgi:hypothetical protein
MKLTIVLAAVLGLVFAVSAIASSPISGTDRANAARACSSLRTSLGVSTFSKQYATFGACTSQWVQRAHAARMAAQTACHTQGLTGRKLAVCVSSHTASTVRTEVTAAKNAAKLCAAELQSLGKTAFEQKYGKNHNLRNAFGKCVSTHAKSSSSGGGTSTSPTQHFAVTLTALNGSGVSGTGSLLLNGNALTFRLDISGLESGQSHTIDIRGLSSGSATCPTASADTNHDGLISATEGAPYFGDELVALDASAHGNTTQTISSNVLPLDTRTVVAFGKTVNGSYDATLPVACGTIGSR